MWTDYFGSFIILLAMAMMLRASFELNRTSAEQQTTLMPSIVAKDEEWREKRKEWARKAVGGYASAQEKKWGNWDEIMFKAKLT